MRVIILEDRYVRGVEASFTVFLHGRRQRPLHGASITARRAQ
jgi:hypothetical protein